MLLQDITRPTALGSFDPGRRPDLSTCWESRDSSARRFFYASRLLVLLDAIHRTGARSISGMGMLMCKSVLAVFTSSSRYKGETKEAYALTLKKRVQYAKIQNVEDVGEGDRYATYALEVSWIRVCKYRSKNEGMRREELLTNDEFVSMVRTTSNVRDRALLWAMYEVHSGQMGFGAPMTEPQ